MEVFFDGKINVKNKKRAIAMLVEAIDNFKVELVEEIKQIKGLIKYEKERKNNQNITPTNPIKKEETTNESKAIIKAKLKPKENTPEGKQPSILDTNRINELKKLKNLLEKLEPKINFSILQNPEIDFYNFIVQKTCSSMIHLGSYGERNKLYSQVGISFKRGARTKNQNYWKSFAETHKNNLTKEGLSYNSENSYN